MLAGYTVITLENLHDKIEQQDISLVNARVSNNKKAVCMGSNFGGVIILDKSSVLNTAEETVLLAHELGHFKTGSLYNIETTANSPLAKMNRRKDEARAAKWAIKELLPVDKLQEVINKRYDEHEIAEHFSVTVDFLREAFEFYKTKGIVFGNGETE
ncbi:MAG: ImmA/IrrE family metallo-endopeptidase [Defluviitaleaceae bacterium]|nr:ImmA/IrrE family metallo-endopeptidase [Defluviitaleaceae bacterium]